MLYELNTPCRERKECEYYIPDLLHNLDTDVKDPIAFDEVLISAEALYCYQVSDTTIIAHCCQTEQEYPRNVQKALTRCTFIHVYTYTASHQNTDTLLLLLLLLLPFLPAAVTPFCNNTRRDLRTSTSASGKPLNSPWRLCLRSKAFFTK